MHWRPPRFAEMGYRFRELTKSAYRESAIPLPKLCIIPMFPKSWLKNFKRVDWGGHRYDYNFIGSINFPGVKENREWVVDFAKNYFTDKSYFRLNAESDFENHEKLGDFDFTFDFKRSVRPYWFRGTRRRYVERENRLNKKRCWFDLDYFQVMCNSDFTLCPAGDRPWSLRFFETIMSKSIPILEKREHSGATQPQRDLGYKFYLLGDDYVYRQDWVDYNYDVFLKKQTLFGGRK